MENLLKYMYTITREVKTCQNSQVSAMAVKNISIIIQCKMFELVFWFI